MASNESKFPLNDVRIIMAKGMSWCTSLSSLLEPVPKVILTLGVRSGLSAVCAKTGSSFYVLSLCQCTLQTQVRADCSLSEQAVWRYSYSLLYNL